MLIRASLRRWLAAGCFALLAPLAHAATFTVTTTSDSGAGSLREAIADAALAANPGADTIGFDAALSGGTISLGSEIVLASIVTVRPLASDLRR